MNAHEQEDAALDKSAGAAVLHARKSAGCLVRLLQVRSEWPTQY